MALLNIREIQSGVQMGLWQMTETIDELYASYPYLQKYKETLSAKYRYDGRKLEFLAIRALLHEMVGDVEIYHLPSGKPMLKGYHVSVSHTKGFAALIVSKTHEVGIDIEYYNNRVERIRSKFMRKDEKAPGLDELLVHWCGKETVYKLFSDDQLEFSQMRVKPFDCMSNWGCEIENLKRKKTVWVDFELTMEFVLTYAVL